MIVEVIEKLVRDGEIELAARVYSEVERKGVCYGPDEFDLTAKQKKSLFAEIDNAEIARMTKETI